MVVKKMLEYSMMSHVDIHLFVYKLGRPRCLPLLSEPLVLPRYKRLQPAGVFSRQNGVHPKTTGITSQEIMLEVAEYWKCSTK